MVESHYQADCNAWLVHVNTNAFQIYFPENAFTNVYKLMLNVCYIHNDKYC